jgi:hypothetical protein
VSRNASLRADVADDTQIRADSIRVNQRFYRRLSAFGNKIVDTLVVHALNDAD